NFLAIVKAVVSEQSGPQEFTGAHNHGEKEKALLATFTAKQSSIHAALCDNFNTKTAMKDIRELISSSTAYYNERILAKAVPSVAVLSKVAKYVTKMMRTFGVFGDANPEIGGGVGATVGGKSLDETLMPYLRAMSSFRDGVRDLAQSKADHVEILKLCDKLRDEDLAELGVVLDDREGGKALVKLVDKEVLLKQREEKKQREAEKQREKEDRLRAIAQKRLEKLEKGRTPPSELFRTEEYSAWDELGIPTTDKEGAELPKSRRKKLEKEHGAQKKLHEEFLAAQANGEL
ncbi:hypothetical protein BDK51DRAFT_27354, partial [Blyttiomyces helicus]